MYASFRCPPAFATPPHGRLPSIPKRATERLARALLPSPAGRDALGRNADVCGPPRPADMVTTVTESAYYGKAMSVTAPGGCAIVKTAELLIVATFASPVVAAEAIPQVHRFCDQLATMIGQL